MRELLILFLITFPQFSFAQSEKTTIFGFKGGYNRSIINGIELDGTKTGFIGDEFYACFFSDSKLTQKWNLENELLFSFTDEYQFIEIPIHVKYFFYKNWNVLLGPKFDFLLNNDDILRGYNFQNFGLSAELGIQYLFFSRILCEMRYSYGFVEQIDDFVLEIYNGKRNTLRIGIGIQF